GPAPRARERRPAHARGARTRPGRGLPDDDGSILMTIPATRADLMRLRRWPTLWVLVGVWTALQVTFSFAFPYLAYRSDDPATAFGGGGAAGDLLAGMLPPAVPEILIAGTPMFGGAI